MNSKRLPRHLAAILYADVVGFSRMSEVDEEMTFLNVREYLDHFARTIETHHGQVIKYAGDAVLAMFDSATDALICAARVQVDVATRNQSLSDDRKICFRIGLNLGDIIQDRGDIFGDGVNVAARLEALGKPGGICVSGSFYDAIVMKLPFDFDSMGDQQVKNISKPIRAYHANLQAGAEIPGPSRGRTIYKPTKGRSTLFPVLTAVAVVALGFALWALWPSSNQQEIKPDTAASAEKISLSDSQQTTILVLPFDDMSSNADQGYFVDGITEDIITDLSRLSNLRVFARSTSFRYKGKTIDPLQVAKELNVTHMLEGSVRRSGDQLRINAQLIDAKNGHHVWAERYDRKLVDVFAVQDEATRNIVNALAIQLTDKDNERLSHSTTNNLAAYDLFLQGRGLYNERTKESSQQAVELYRQAITLDPQYARAYGGLAIARIRAVRSGWSDSPAFDKDRALELARKATALDSNSQHAYWSLGFVHLFRGEHSEAVEAVKQAINIAPSYADGYALLAFINNSLGNAEEAIRLVNKAKPLNPHYSFDYPYNLGLSYYTLGQYERAVELLEEALERNANAQPPRLVLVASYMGLGMQEEAEWEVEQLLNQNPSISFTVVANESLIADPRKKKDFLDRLRQAGLPE